jgi:hypothetical protein
MIKKYFATLSFPVSTQLSSTLENKKIKTEKMFFTPRDANTERQPQIVY